MTFQPFDPGAAAQGMGLSQLPQPTNLREFARSLHTYYPAELVGSGVKGSVLLSLDLDATGAVIAARAVDPPSIGGVVARAVVLDGAGAAVADITRSSEVHPALKRAAEAAGACLQFSPAERAGNPVSFSDYRLTVEIAPPSG